MARGFKVRRVTVDGTRALRYAARLDAAERALVAGLMEQVAELIGAPVPSPEADDAPADEFEAIVGRLGIGGADSPEGEAGSRGERPSHIEGQEDPAIRRLFPIANRTDPEAAAEFARLSEAGLRQRKFDNLRRAAELLGRGGSVELTPADAQVLLVALTDVRVVLGERMGLRTDEDAAGLEAVAATLEESDPRLQFILVYDFLTWLQESLATALLRGLD